MKEIEIRIDTEEMADYLFGKLVQEGFVPSENELDTVAHIMFDYMIHKGIIDEEIE